MKKSPAQCVDLQDVSKLQEQGIKISDYSLTVHPNYVIITLENTTTQMSMKTFEFFTKWYITDSELDNGFNFEEMKPCESKNDDDVRLLDKNASLVMNGYTISVLPPFVYVQSYMVDYRIPMKIFKQFVDWYFEEQELIQKSSYQSFTAGHPCDDN